MYDIILSVITEGEFELVDILHKINKLWVENQLTEEERDELIDKARSNAIPDASYAENATQIANLWEYYQQLDHRLSLLENNSGSVEQPDADEYPVYVKPTGAHNVYNTNDKITFQDKKYICKMDNCVWDPLTYPAAWEEVQ